MGYNLRMIRTITAAGAALAIAGSGVALTGCGSSSSSGSAAAAAHTTTLPSGQTLVEAADRAARAPGYRLDAAIDVKVGAESVTIQMKGVTEQNGTVGAFTMAESVAGHRLNLQVRLSHGMFYMSGIPGLSQIAGGKHWLSFNLAATRQAEGLGGLQTSASSNPAQFLSYLRTVGTDVTRVGGATIDGEATTEYRAELDLDRYTKLVPAAQRTAARTSIARLEAQLGTHTLPVTVWVNARHEVRRMHLQMPACADGQHLSMSMTMNFSDYGHVPPVTIPSAADTDNITRQVKSKLPSSQTQSGATSCPSTGA